MKELLIRFLDAYRNHDVEKLKTIIREDTELHSSMVGNVNGIEIIKALELPFVGNVNHLTFTNYIEGENVCIACLHHLIGIDEDKVLYPLLYGGKIKLVKEGEELKEIDFQLEYEYGNTFVTKNQWKLYEETKNVSIITVNEIPFDSQDIKEAVYKFFLSLDLENEDLFKSVTTEDIQIQRNTENNYQYFLDGQADYKSFIAQDKNYYSQNQYSVLIRNCEKTENNEYKVEAWHLDPGRPGNKHLCNSTEYSQFFNEIIRILVIKDIDGYKVKKVTFKHKENPVLYGWTLMEL